MNWQPAWIHREQVSFALMKPIPLLFSEASKTVVSNPVHLDNRSLVVSHCLPGGLVPWLAPT